MTTLQATDFIVTFSTRPSGAFIQQQRGEFVVTLSDAFEWRWRVIAIWTMALALVIDDGLGWLYRKVLSIQAAIDNWRLGCFVFCTGVRCLAGSAG